jgi:hypothetical protein
MFPFNDDNSSTPFGKLHRAILAEINGLENDYIAKASLTELEEHFIAKGTIIPLILHADKHYVENISGTRIDVSHDFNRAVFPGERAIVQGTRVDVAIPFEGDPQLWRIRATTFSPISYPKIEIKNDRVVVTYSFPDDSPDPERLKQRIHQDIASLSSAVGYLARDVEKHNCNIKPAIRSALASKHKNALAAMNAVANLGIPLKRSAVPATYTVPAQHRQTPVSMPRVTTGPFRPEPTLDMAEYDHILDILRSMTLVMERSPQAFVTLDEEAVRTHFLLQLNGHYEGTATGETFNAEGKTDILIRVENRNIFIAECKFWRGPKSFDDAISQLLAYLSWKDSKCALLVFNRGGESTAIRKKMDEIMTKRLEFRSNVTVTSDGDARYVVVKSTDPGKEIIITTMLFDVPCSVPKDGTEANNTSEPVFAKRAKGSV